MKFFKKIIFAVTALSFAFGTSVTPVSASVVGQGLDYSDSLVSVDNPDRGFYEPLCYHLQESGGSAKSPTSNLVHLRLDISAFSGNAILDDTTKVTGTSEPISDDALQNIRDTLAYIKSKGHTAIVRACYDPWYNGKSNYEPDQELILQHLQQLGEVYTEYADVIAYVELGMYGPWGEMHTSKCCTKANVTEALNTLLAATPDTIKIGVRTPAYIADWLGIEQKDFDVNSDAFKTAIEAKGKDIYRVGMYNDGYLGSSTDLGTFGTITRAKGVEWLNEYAKYTLYGGECVANSGGGTIGEYNTIGYISKEGFQTHTSYLNKCWNDSVIKKWKDEETYTGDDEYNGQTAFKYINDHLGYRLVMRNSALPLAVKSGGNMDLDLGIENVGFGNMVNSRKVTIVLKNTDGDVVEITPNDNINPCNFLSTETTDIKTSVDLTDVKSGEWKVYFRISKYGDLASDSNYGCVRFGNAEAYWDKTIGANYIGKVTVVPENISKTDIAYMLKYIGGSIDKTELSQKCDYTATDANSDGVVDMKDVVLLISAM